MFCFQCPLASLSQTQKTAFQLNKHTCTQLRKTQTWYFWFSDAFVRKQCKSIIYAHSPAFCMCFSELQFRLLVGCLVLLRLRRLGTDRQKACHREVRNAIRLLWLLPPEALAFRSRASLFRLESFLRLFPSVAWILLAYLCCRIFQWKYLLWLCYSFYYMNYSCALRIQWVWIFIFLTGLKSNVLKKLINIFAFLVSWGRVIYCECCLWTVFYTA